MGGNLATSLRKRLRARPMEEFDHLPPELRGWLARAALPWSARSAARIWRKAGRDGNAEDRCNRLDAIERAMLRRDAIRTWGPDYPA